MPEIPNFAVTAIAWDAGKGFAKIIFKDTMRHNLGRRGTSKVLEAAMVTAQYQAPRIESYMKINAPWTDRTGNARNGLAARAYRDGDEIGIVLYHQVFYGIFLEVRWDGKYAIIDPTIEAKSDEVMAQFNRLLDRM